MTVGLLSVTNKVKYEGLVAGRARLFTVADPTITQLMGRYGLTATENLSFIRFVFHNFILGTHDVGPGGPCTITAGVEYPAGTFKQILFGGSAMTTIPSGGLIFSDFVNVSNIPAAATFWTRQFIQNPSGVCYCNWQPTTFGCLTNGSTSGVTDQTMGGTISNTQTGICVPPLAVLGFTVNPSVVVTGDSIGFGAGSNGDLNDNAGKLGLICQSMGNIPFLNLSVSGFTAQNWTTSVATRNLLIPKASHLIQQLGVNDLSNGRTLPQITADYQLIYALARPGQKIIQTTITPHSSSTDSWATTGNQTGLNLAARAALNQAIRAGISGATGFFDTASILETSQDSDIWKVPAVPPYTADGLHPNQAGYDLIQASGVIGPIGWP